MFLNFAQPHSRKEMCKAFLLPQRSVENVSYYPLEKRKYCSCSTVYFLFSTNESYSCLTVLATLWKHILRLSRLYLFYSTKVYQRRVSNTFGGSRHNHTAVLLHVRQPTSVKLHQAATSIQTIFRRETVIVLLTARKITASDMQLQPYVYHTLPVQGRNLLGTTFCNASGPCSAMDQRAGLLIQRFRVRVPAGIFFNLQLFTQIALWNKRSSAKSSFARIKLNSFVKSGVTEVKTYLFKSVEYHVQLMVQQQSPQRKDLNRFPDKIVHVLHWSQLSRRRFSCVQTCGQW